MLRSSILTRAMGALAAIAVSAASIAAAPIPLPRVEGPIPVTAQSHPFLGAAWQAEPVDLAKWGYVEEEYFLSGRANVYEYAADHSLRQLRAGPYVNRILVRRPKDARRANGRALVEMFNASAGPDISFQWSNGYDYLMSHGYVYVAITSKPYSMERLKQFDPARYGRLSWANPDPASGCKEPGPWAIFPGWSTNANEDGLLWDMVSQLGALLKSRDAANPLRAAPPRRLYLSGHSQSGGYVGTIARDFQQSSKMPDGSPIYDGYMQTGASGLTPLNQCTQSLSYDNPHLVMKSEMPLIRIMTLTDFYDYTPILSNYRLRGRPDSDAKGDLFRLWEVAGAWHSTYDLFKYGAAAPADVARAGGRPMTPTHCLGTGLNTFPLGIAFNAALEALDRWRDGTPAPHAARIEMDRPAGDPQARPIRDATGNVLGGYRSPTVDVPVAGYYGKAYVDGDNAASCGSKGYVNALSAEQLKSLYPDHASYVNKVKASVAALESKRMLTNWDGKRLIQAAERSAVP